MERQFKLKKSTSKVSDHRHILTLVSKSSQIASEADLRPYMPHIYDQLEIGSCQSNAVGALLEYNNVEITPSRLFIYYNVREIENTIEMDSGGSLTDTIEAVKKYGAPDESLWAYIQGKFTMKPDDAAYVSAKPDTVIQAYACETVDDIKLAVANKFPVAIGLLLHQSFESPQVAQTGIVPLPTDADPILGGHALVVVGYSDSRQCFIVRNSWGESWGDHGHCYVPYAYFTPDRAFDFWVVQSVVHEDSSMTKT